MTSEGPTIWCWHAGPGLHIGKVSKGAEAIVRRAGTTTIYEARFSKQILSPLKLEEGHVFGFNTVVDDCDTERNGAIAFAPGMVFTKDPSQYVDAKLTSAPK